MARPHGRFHPAILTLTAALALTLSACGSTSAPRTLPSRFLQRVTVLTGFNITGEDAHLFAGIKKGIFARHGLDVTVAQGKGTDQNLAALNAGRAQFVIVDTAGALLAHGREENPAKNVKIFTAVHQLTAAGILTLDPRITSPKDLEGKTVGYARGEVNYSLFPAYARLAGIDKNTIKWRDLDAADLRPELLSGRVDAVTDTAAGRPTVQLGVGNNRSVTVLPYSDYLGDLYGNAWATTTTTVENKPDLVRRFRDAVLESLTYALDNPQEAAHLTVNANPAVSAPALTAEIEVARTYIRTGPPVGHIDPARITRSIVTLRDAGLLPAGSAPRPEDLLAIDLLPT